MSTALDQKIADLTARVAANTTVEESVLTFIKGLKAQLDAAIIAAQNAGATPAQLDALTSLGTTIQANSDALAAAVVAGTPGGPGGGNPPPPV